MNETILQESFLAQLVMGTSEYAPGIIPDAIVDCINTATALAYQDIYTSAAEVLDIYDRATQLWTMGKEKPAEQNGEYVDAVERLLASIYVPQLVRHVQILHEAMHRAGTRAYIKVGTSGTGGMGLNIPYTHGEEKPSRVLLSKTAMAGAHTLLLFLMARTPGGPVVKEVKPTAAITWKQIGYGPIRKRGRPFPLYDCPPNEGVRLEEGREFALETLPVGREVEGVLESVFIDTGENGYFSLAEYTALTALGQMEAVTPEDIAVTVVRELEGINTGRDVINALDGAVLGPSYRAGVLRQRAIALARHLEAEHGVESVAFEILGPPKLSKLLYEAYMLKRVRGTVSAVAASDPQELSDEVSALVHEDARLRQSLLSIGIPILMPDGRTLLAANRRRPEHRWERYRWQVTPETIERWAESEWVDLRVANMARWVARMQRLLDEAAAVPSPDFDSSSRYDRPMFDPATWAFDDHIDIGEIAAWIFSTEEGGRRMKE